MDSLDKLLEDLKKQDQVGKTSFGFKVPDGYFEQLTEDILAKTETKAQPKVQVFNLWKYASIAAAFLAILSIFLLKTSSEEVMTKTELFSELSQKESLDYLINNQIEISTDELLELENIDEIIDDLKNDLEL